MISEITQVGQIIPETQTDREKGFFAHIERINKDLAIANRRLQDMAQMLQQATDVNEQLNNKISKLEEENKQLKHDLETW